MTEGDRRNQSISLNDGVPTVGVVGIGSMGEPIVRQLSESFETVAFDLDDDRLSTISDFGVQAAHSPEDLGKKADVVLLSLPSSKAVDSASLGNNGVIAGFSGREVLIDTSTIDPEVTSTVASKCDSAGVAFLDAPVSGGPRNARNGNLTTMVGGESETLDSVRPIFGCYCDSVYHVGGRGTGVAMKLANNYMLAANSAVAFEALTLARRSGIDVDKFLQVSSSSSGDSYALQRNIDRFVKSGRYDAEAQLSVMAKDARLAEGLGRRLEVPMLVGGATSSTYRLAEMHGLAKRDFAALIALYDPTIDVDG